MVYIPRRVRLEASLTEPDWDAWRENYPVTTFAEQQEFLQSTVVQFPHQRHFDVDEAYAAFALIDDPRTVIELGGWDGALAWFMLLSNEIESWVNYDIVAVPQVEQLNGRYRTKLLSDYIWKQPITADVFVGTHVIEHLSEDHLRQLLVAIETRWIYFEAPLLSDGESWEGYGGTHVLELSWPEVEVLVDSHGYEIVRSNKYTRLWRSRA